MQDLQGVALMIPPTSLVVTSLVKMATMMTLVEGLRAAQTGKRWPPISVAVFVRMARSPTVASVIPTHRARVSRGNGGWARP
jgi:hypothetical protein